MSASSVNCHKSTVRSVSLLSAFLRHINTNTLAFALFVALALLSTSRGKELETRESAHARDTGAKLAIGACDTSPQHGERHKFTAKDFGNKVAPNRYGQVKSNPTKQI